MLWPISHGKDSEHIVQEAGWTLGGLDRNEKSHPNRGSNCGMSRCSESLY